MFVFENVPGIHTAKNGHYLKLIFDAVKEAGYELDKKVLNAKDFGVYKTVKELSLSGGKMI